MCLFWILMCTAYGDWDGIELVLPSPANWGNLICNNLDQQPTAQISMQIYTVWWSYKLQFSIICSKMNISLLFHINCWRPWAWSWCSPWTTIPWTCSSWPPTTTAMRHARHLLTWHQREQVTSWGVLQRRQSGVARSICHQRWLATIITTMTI